MRRAWLALLCLCSAMPTSARPYRVEDMLSLEGYGAIRIDPSGRWGLVEKLRPYAEAPSFTFGGFTDLVRTHVYRVDFAHPGPLLPLMAMDPHAGYWVGSFSPSGRMVQVFRLTAERLQVGIVTIADGTAVWLENTPDLPRANPLPVWIDDDHLLMVTRRRPELPFILGFNWDKARRDPVRWAATASGQTPSVDVLTTTGEEETTLRAAENDLQLVDIRSAASTLLMTGHISDLSLSPDLRHIAIVQVQGIKPVVATGAGTTPEHHGLAIYDLALGRLTSIESGDVFPNLLSWSADGSRLLFATKMVSSSHEAILHRFGAKQDRFEREDVYLPRLALTAEEDLVTGHASWSGKDIVGQFIVSNDKAQWQRLSNGNSARAITPPASADASEKIDPWKDGLRSYLNPALALSHSATRHHSSAALVVEKAEDGSAALKLNLPGCLPATLDTINGRLIGIDRPDFLRVVTQHASGEIAYHWLVLPHNRVGKPPLIVVPYPGKIYGPDAPKLDPAHVGAPANPLLLAGAGFAVLLPSIALPPNAHDPLEVIKEAVDGATDGAIAKNIIDADHMALYGQSYGGYTALGVAADNPRFKAVIASAAPDNLTTVYGSIDPRAKEGAAAFASARVMMKWSEIGQGRMGSPPWGAADRYVRNSPIFAADRITAPVLLIQGDFDPVPISQGEQMFMALLRQGKDATLLRYAGEAHTLVSPANITDQWHRIIGWLNVKLFAAPTPTSAPTPQSSHRR